jgi:alginate O-acetyltransferase complex protein AlgJ
MKNRFRAYGIVLVFLAIIVSPFLNDQFHLIKDIENFENRRLASFPKADSMLSGLFTYKLENYYNDHFSLRSRIINAFNFFNIYAFKKSPVPKYVIIGNDDWLFPVGEELDSYQGKNRLTPEELEAFKLELEYRQKYLAERGCKFYFMIAPCKASIYPEKIGYEYFRMNKQSWGEQLNDYLKKNSSVNVIDVFDSLRLKKNEGVALYYRLDNHWNPLGAFHAANAAINFMRKDFPVLSPLLLQDYNLIYKDSCGGNVATMLGKLDFYSEPCMKLEPKKEPRARDGRPGGYPCIQGFAYPWLFELDKETADSTKPSFLYICDSFGEHTFTYFSEHFSRSVKIWDAWQYKLNENIVEGEKPDIMLIMVDEPVLRNLLKHQSRLPAETKAKAGLKQS